MITTDISADQIAELKRAICRARPHVGKAEEELCISRALEGNSTATAAQLLPLALEQLDEMRREFTGGSTLLSEQAWGKVYSASEDKAQRSLLDGSSEQKEADKLNKAAQESQRTAAAAESALRSSLAEFMAIPDAAALLRGIFKRLAHERAQLDPEHARIAYRELYRSAFEHPEQEFFGAEAPLIAALVTAPLREEVLLEIENQTKTKYEILKKRNIELSRKLGRPAHKL